MCILQIVSLGVVALVCTGVLSSVFVPCACTFSCSCACVPCAVCVLWLWVARYKKHLSDAEKNGIKKGLAAGLVMASFFALMFVMSGVGLYFGVHLVLDFRNSCLRKWIPILKLLPLAELKCEELQIPKGVCARVWSIEGPRGLCTKPSAACLFLRSPALHDYIRVHKYDVATCSALVVSMCLSASPPSLPTSPTLHQRPPLCPCFSPSSWRELAWVKRAPSWVCSPPPCQLPTECSRCGPEPQMFCPPFMFMWLCCHCVCDSCPPAASACV